MPSSIDNCSMERARSAYSFSKLVFKNAHVVGVDRNHKIWIVGRVCKIGVIKAEDRVLIIAFYVADQVVGGWVGFEANVCRGNAARNDVLEGNDRLDVIGVHLEFNHFLTVFSSFIIKVIVIIQLARADVAAADRVKSLGVLAGVQVTERVVPEPHLHQ